MSLSFLKWEKVRVVLEYAVYLILTMMLQSLLFSKVSILGVKGFILPAAAVAAGMYLGGVRGAVFGLCLGIFTDIGFTDSTVLYTVLFAFIGFAVGFAAEFYLNSSFFAFMVFSAIAMLISGFAQLLCAMILHGAGLFSGLWVMLLQTLVSIIPAMLLYLPFKNRSAIGQRR